MQVPLLPADAADSEGYPKFNGGKHLCVDVPSGHFTISCNTQAGHKITFAFVEGVDGKHECVDIHLHTGPKFTKQGCDSPTMNMLAFSGGGTAFVSDDDNQVTLAAVILRDDPVY